VPDETVGKVDARGALNRVTIDVGFGPVQVTDVTAYVRHEHTRTEFGRVGVEFVDI
jgi:hypothetical protein